MDASETQSRVPRVNSSLTRRTLPTTLMAEPKKPSLPNAIASIAARTAQPTNAKRIRLIVFGTARFELSVELSRRRAAYLDALASTLVRDRAITRAVPTFRELTFRRGALMSARFATRSSPAWPTIDTIVHC
jgi:hypothetical protein